MKKLLTILFFLSFTIVSSQVKKTYTIGILIDTKSEELSPLLLKLKHEIQAVVGEDAIINFPLDNILYNSNNLELAKKNYQKLLTDNTDIILAFGLINSVVVNTQKKFEKPVFLFGNVNRDLLPIQLNSKVSGIHNLNYLINNSSFKKDITKFKELTGFKKLGVFIEQELLKNLPIKENLDTYLTDYIIIPFKNVNDILNNFQNIDAAYFTGGYYLSLIDKKNIINQLKDKKTPSFITTNIQDVELGFMATHQTEDNFQQFFRRIALNIEQYINGKPLAELPTFLATENILTINYNTAQSVDIPIKYSLIASTNFVGDINNNTSKIKYEYLDVINKTLDRNLSLKSSKKDIALSEQNIKETKSAYLPNLTAAALGTYLDPKVASAGNPEFSTNGTITLNQVLFSASANTGIGINKDLKKAQEEIYNASELDAIFQSSQLYFNALILKTNVAIRMQNLVLTKKNLKIAKQNFETGQSSKTDVLRFKSQFAQNTQALIEAINQLEKGFISLNQLLNNDLSLDIDVADVDLNKGIFTEYNYQELKDLLDNPNLSESFITFLISEAKKNAPEIKSLNYNLNATKRNIKLNSNGRFLPTVALQGQYNHVFSKSGIGSTISGIPNSNYNVGLNLSIPIFNQNKTNISRKTGIIQKDQLEINRTNIELSISANVRNNVLSLINQVSNVELSKVSVSTAKESLELVQNSYANGAVSFIQLIDAQNNFISAQISNANANYNFIISALELERTIGYNFLLNKKTQNDQFRARFLEFIK